MAIDFSQVTAITIPEGSATAVAVGGTTLWQSVSYEYITPIDPVAFPTRNGLELITLNGTENWKVTSGGAYTSDFGDIIKNQQRASVVGYCADYEFLPSVSGIASMTNDSFIFNGTSSVPVNGNLSFKNANTTSVSDWTAYLAQHPLTILISTNDPDTSEWKPAKRLSDDVTGYWNGGSGFVAVYGGIPYYGDNLITDAVIAGAYSNAWISSDYKWTTASNSYSFPVAVEDGKYYHVEWDTTASGTVGAVFRYGFTDNNTPSSSNVLAAPRARTTPQDAASVDLLASGNYFIVQVAGATFPANTEHLSIREMIGYTPSNNLLMGGNPFSPPIPDPDELEEE